MTPKITLAYITHRRTPKWEWFVDSLFDQTTPEQRATIQLVFVDGLLWDDVPCGLNPYELVALANPVFHDAHRRSQLEAVIAGRFNYLHVPPMPCAYQGPFRQTKRDMFCAGLSRNTAFVVAGGSFVVFVDDLSVLMPQWFNQVRHATEDGYVVCGMYWKQLKMVVENGKLISFENNPSGRDSRWDHGSDGGVMPWLGGMFGCSFGLPLEAALEVDGNDCALLGAGAEDTDFGIRLRRAGWQIFLNRNMLTIESEELHHDGSKLPQERKLVSPECLPKNYEAYQHVNHDERYWSDHVVLNRICNETERILPLIGDNLRELRARYLATGLVPVPAPNQRDWRDGKLLSEL